MPLKRTPLRSLSASRVLRGGRLADAGRLPRYAAIAAIAAACIWAPITGYLRTAPLSYSSRLSLILPGAGASASMTIDEIGSASSYAASAFSSSSMSPTETYKRLMGADRIVDAAAAEWGGSRLAYGRPRVELVDQTGFIHVTLAGGSPEEAQAKGEALLATFFDELDALRADEAAVREGGGTDAIAEYRASVQATRGEIERLRAETGILRTAQWAARVSANDELTAELHAIEARLAQAQETAQALQSTLGLTPDLAAATLRLANDGSLAGLREELAAATQAFTEADARYGAQHPKMTAARAMRDAATAALIVRAAALTGLPEAEAARLDTDPAGERAMLLARLVEAAAAAEGLAAEAAELAARHAAEAEALAALAPQVARIEALQRDYDVAEAVFASAIARSQTVKSDVYAAYPLVQVLENPSLPDAPSSPKRKLAIAAGAAATIMMLMGLLLGWIRRPLIGRLVAEGSGEAAPASAALA